MSMEEKGKILVVDDEPAIRKALRGTLTALGFQTDEASSGERGIELARQRQYDAVLLDSNMPGIGGLETCRILRRESPRTGILMLTVRDSEEDKIEALEAGADDYITKPFVMRELAARIRAIRRGRAPADPQEQPIQIGDLALNPGRYRVTKAGVLLRLTPIEFNLLEYFMRNPGKPIPHQVLLQAIWGPEYGGEVEYLRTFVRQLRKKIEDNPAAPSYLTTYPYIGYYFRAPGE